jgi:hypothetical protein
MALRKARAAVASSPEVEAAAEEVLGRGNAIDAIVAAVFAACALSPGCLLGPVQLLVGGAGAGLRAIDGRVRQPGLGAPRPRGFLGTDEIPDAARVGVPWLPATLAVATATMGSATFAQALAPAIALAKGSPRQRVLKRIASHGPRALEDHVLSTELLGTFGRPSGGLLTGDDLAAPRPEVQRAARTALGERALVTLPWANVDGHALRAPAHEVDVARARSALAVDRNGTFAIASWDEPAEGLLVEELALRAPFFAEPVRRGQTRVRPGDPRPAAAPVAMVGADAPEIALAAFGAGDAYDVLTQALDGLRATDQISASGEARLVALSHAKGTAAVLRA